MKIQSSDWSGWEKWCLLSIRLSCLVPGRPSSDIPVSLYPLTQWITLEKITEAKHRREEAPSGNKCISQQEELILKTDILAIKLNSGHV